MQRLDLTLPTAAENVALDEALLDWAEEDPAGREVLRIWESPQPVVVAGRSSRIAQEIDTDTCGKLGIPIVRRSSGGATIVAGPGCLMYAVVLSFQARPELRDISLAHRFALGRIVDALNPLIGEAGVVACGGTSDLALTDASPAALARKFSGNSMRVKRNHFLYHGTLLYNFNLQLLASCLRTAPRQPGYRSAREHLDFVMNVPLTRQQLLEALAMAWPTASDLIELPTSRVAELVATRFSHDSWNLDFG